MRTLLGALLLALSVILGCGEELPAAGDPCDSLVDCVAGERLSCLVDVCAEVPCERSASCPAGAACIDGVCDAPECASDTDCGSGICFEGDCRQDLCSGNASCPVGLICRGTPPECVEPPDRCENDLECASNTFCKLPEAECVPLCDEESDCPGSSYCDGRFCREPCLTSSACPGTSVCVAGRCADPRACDGVSCSAAAPFVNPLDCTCRACLADGDCALADGERCVDGACSFCPVRTELPNACVDRGFLFDDGCCVACLSDADCVVGSKLECERGVCVEERSAECRSDADCPTGQACAEGTCRKSGSGQSCQRQADCPDAEGCYADGRCWGQSDVCGACSQPARCVAEDGDLEGTCAGCTDPCASESCPDGKICSIAPGEAEGVCLEVDFTPACPG